MDHAVGLKPWLGLRSPLRGADQAAETAFVRVARPFTGRAWLQPIPVLFCHLHQRSDGFRTGQITMLYSPIRMPIGGPARITAKKRVVAVTRERTSNPR